VKAVRQLARKGFADDGFRLASTVKGSKIKQCYASVDGLLYGEHSLFSIRLSPHLADTPAT
jgi:hypothetical protein